MRNCLLTLSLAGLAGLNGISAQTTSGTLPVLYINTENSQEIVSKEDYLKAGFWLDASCDDAIESLGSQNAPLETQIKGRGNYSWSGFDKKPYRLKTVEKTPLMGLKKSKHFGLLAHADDNLYFMRNALGFELSRRLGLAWTPEDRPLELVLNGEYRGLYILTELIKVAKDRVNITEQDDLATTDVDGGWFVEIDNYDTDPHVEITEGNGERIIFTYKSPEELSNEQETFLRTQMQAINDAIYNSDKNSTTWEEYIDIESAARFYVVQEIMDDCESYHGSCYLTRDRGADQKWHFGPVWDFGNAYQRGNKAEFIWQNATFNQTWIGELYKFPRFQAKVKEVWKEFCETGYPNLVKYICDYSDKIESAAALDYERWPEYGSSDKEGLIGQVVRNLNSSVTWLGEKWGTSPQLEYIATPDVTVYLRGDMNDWGLSANFVSDGNGNYTLSGIDILSKDGFKIASEDWKAIDYGAPSEESSDFVKPEKTYQLTKAGKNMHVATDVPNACVKFDLNNATLTITDATGVEIPVISGEENPEIFTVTGVRVSEATAPGIYILRYSDRTVKIIR